MSRLTVRGFVLALATTALVAVPASATQAAAAHGKSCNPSKYKTHYGVSVTTKAPAITHIGTYAFPPAYHRTTKRTATKQLVLSAAVKYSSGAKVEVGLPGKILGNASAQVNMSLAANGKHTSTKSSSVTEYVANNTKHNQQFVFYRGQTRAQGKFTKYYCRIYYLPGQNYGPAYVTTVGGTWRSFAIPGDGALRCGAGTGNLGALARAALKLGCAA